MSANSPTNNKASATANNSFTSKPLELITLPSKSEAEEYYPGTAGNPILLCRSNSNTEIFRPHVHQKSIYIPTNDPRFLGFKRHQYNHTSLAFEISKVLYGRVNFVSMDMVTRMGYTNTEGNTVPILHIVTKDREINHEMVLEAVKIIRCIFVKCGMTDVHVEVIQMGRYE